MSIPAAILQFAEDPEHFTDDPPLPTRRIVRPQFTLILSPSPAQSAVCSVRTTVEDLDAVIAEARSIARQAGYSRTIWNVGPSATPAGLAALLLARGFVPATAEPFEPVMTAMALVKPPPDGPAGIAVRRAANEEEFTQGLRIMIEAFGMNEVDADGWLSAAPTLWAQQDGVRRFLHLAFLDGEPVGFAFNLTGPGGLLLGGSGVLPAARGRGAYRALLAARWADAVALGKPALVVQAGAMSRPVLERCGFEVVCRMDNLDDPTMSHAS